MFNRDSCDLCGDCLVKCQWIEAERPQAIEWLSAMIAGDETPVLRQCITCYACNEICPRNANPFDLISELQERYRTFGADEAVRADEAKYTFTGQLKDVPQAPRIMSTCLFFENGRASPAGRAVPPPAHWRQALLLLDAVQSLGGREHSASARRRIRRPAGRDGGEGNRLLPR